MSDNGEYVTMARSVCDGMPEQAFNRAMFYYREFQLTVGMPDLWTEPWHRFYYYTSALSDVYGVRIDEMLGEIRRQYVERYPTAMTL